MCPELFIPMFTSHPCGIAGTPHSLAQKVQYHSTDDVLSLGTGRWHSDTSAKQKWSVIVILDCLAAKITPTHQREGEDGQWFVTSLLITGGGFSWHVVCFVCFSSLELSSKHVVNGIRRCLLPLDFHLEVWLLYCFVFLLFTHLSPASPVPDAVSSQREMLAWHFPFPPRAWLIIIYMERYTRD